MQERELERAVAEALAQLPAVTAPDTLLPRVIAAANRLHSRPWYARPWHTWPQPYQVSSLSFCLLALAAVVFPWPLAEGGWWQPLMTGLTGHFGAADFVEEAARVSHAAAAIAAAGASIWRTFCVPLLVYAAGVATLLCAAVALFTLALDRLTPGKALPQ